MLGIIAYYAAPYGEPLQSSHPPYSIKNPYLYTFGAIFSSPRRFLASRTSPISRIYTPSPDFAFIFPLAFTP